MSGHTAAMWPYSVGAVPGLANCFQPRALIDDLVEATEGGGTAVLAGAATARTQLLSGLGGVGKTQLAVHLANRLRDTGQLDLLVWVSATSRSAILAGYAQAASDLALPGANGVDTDRDAARFHGWLATTESRWLVVLDDLIIAADMKLLWPPSRRLGRTVVTTRLRGSTLHNADRSLIQVGTFTEGEATAYLAARLDSRPELADDVARMATDLGCLPLALAQASAFVLDENVPCSEYRRRFADRRTHLNDLVPDPHSPTGLPDDYHLTVAATLSLSIDVADRSRPAGLARPLLELASMLDPAGIPVPVFTTTATRTWLADRQGYGHGSLGKVDDALIRSGLQSLHRLNLITTGTETVRVHGLVQRAAIDATRPDRLPGLAHTAADALLSLWPDIERDRGHAELLRANCAALYATGGEHLWSDEGVHTVLIQTGYSFGNAGLVAAAVDHFAQLSAEAQRRFGVDHPAAMVLRHEHGDWRGEAGDAAGAAAAFEQLLADRLRVLGPDHLDTFTARHELAHWRGVATGDTADVVAALEQLLADRMCVLGPDHRDTLATRGYLLMWRGTAATAADFEQLLADRVRVLGPDHRDTLATRDNYASWKGNAGDAASAAAAFEQLLDDRLRILGPEHPDTLATRHELVYWRAMAVDRAGVVADLEQLLADRLRILGNDHPDTLATRHSHAYWTGDTGDAAGAVTALEQLILDRTRILGADHPDTLTTRHSHAYRKGEAGDAAGAATALEQLILDRTRVLGADHPDTLVTRHSHAYWTGEAGDAAGAAEALEQLLADRTRVLGPDHCDTLTTRQGLVGALFDVGRWQANNAKSHVPDREGSNAVQSALSSQQQSVWFDRSLATFQDVLGRLDPGTEPGTYGIVLHEIADVHLAKGDAQQGIAAYQQAVEHKARANDPGDLTTTLYALAGCLIDIGDLQEARTALIRAEKEAGQASASAEPAVRAIRAHRRGQLYERLGSRKQDGAYANALSAYHEALALLDTDKDPGSYGVVLRDIGDVHAAMGSLPEAASAYEEAAIRHTEAGSDPRALVSIKIELGRIYRDLGMCDAPMTTDPGEPQSDEP